MLYIYAYRNWLMIMLVRKAAVLDTHNDIYDNDIYNILYNRRVSHISVVSACLLWRDLFRLSCLTIIDIILTVI